MLSFWDYGWQILHKPISKLVQQLQKGWERASCLYKNPASIKRAGSKVDARSHTHGGWADKNSQLHRFSSLQYQPFPPTTLSPSPTSISLTNLHGEFSSESRCLSPPHQTLLPAAPWETSSRYSHPRRLPLLSLLLLPLLSKDHHAGSVWLCTADMQSRCISKVPDTAEHFTLYITQS